MKKPIRRKVISDGSEEPITEPGSAEPDSAEPRADTSLADASLDTESSDDDIDLTIPHISREKIEMIAGTKVGVSLDLYRRSLVHKSIQKLVKKKHNSLAYLKESNERLEFVGDSIIGSVVADYLFTKYPSRNEGDLTKYRTRIVNGKMLSFFAESIGIKDNILMSKQVINMNGTNNQRFLEDAFESFVGAIYYDRGFEAAKTFILSILSKYLKESVILKDDNYKDLLLRYAQFLKTAIPVYNTLQEHGQPHNRQFVIEVVMFGERQGRGVACIKREAEQLAALEAITRLNIPTVFK